MKAALAVVRSHHRRRRLIWLVWALAAALAADAAVLLGREVASAVPALVGLGLAAAALAFVGTWLRRSVRLREADAARNLDQVWRLRARLESVWEMRDDGSGFAAGQRADATERIGDRRAPSVWPWRAAVAAVAVAVAALVGLALVGRLNRPAPSPVPSVAAERTAPPPPPSSVRSPLPPVAARAEPTEAIRWLAPNSRIQATAIEEIRLRAAVSVRSGLSGVGLNVSVNGAEPKGVAVPAELAAVLAQPGDHAIELALYLDEFALKPFDVVSYFLTADLAGPGAIRALRSPLQFIQIRRVPDAAVDGPSSAAAAELVSRLFALQAAQMDLLDRNFRLVDSASAPRIPASAALGGKQGALAVDTRTLRGDLLRHNGPADAARELDQAAAAMAGAGRAIAAGENAAAVPGQQDALAHLVACDRFLHRTKRGPPNAAANPFRDLEKFALPDRAKGEAGELEKLTAEQDRVVSDLSGAAGEGAARAGAAEPGLADRMQALAQGHDLSDGARAAAERAGREAGSAERRLAAGDAAGALPPAAAASAALHEAMNREYADARALALALLETERRALNRALGSPRAPERESTLRTVAEELRTGAVVQQEHGSTALAQGLLGLARQVARIGGVPDPAREQSTLRAAAAAQVAVAGVGDAIDRTVRQLDRGRRSLGEGTADAGRADLQLAAQLARELLPSPAQQAAADRVAGEAPAAAVGGLADGAFQLQQAVRSLRGPGGRDERVRRFSAEEIDPAYRAAVEAYFTALSRGAGTP
jgi:hypothetical protein